MIRVRLTLAPLLACLIFTNAISPIELDDWQCGSEEQSRRSAYGVVIQDCPLVSAEVNHCCVVHDECYLRQFGQGECDREFCECNKVVLNRTEGADCRFWADAACFLLPFVGHISYEKSVNYIEPADLPKRLPSVVRLQDRYKSLYTYCPRVNATLSSCAVVFNHCADDRQKCGAMLCSCIREAQSLDNDYDCNWATADFCEFVDYVSNADEVNPFYGSHKIFIALLGGFTLGFLFARIVLYFWKRQRASEGSSKYSVIRV